MWKNPLVRPADFLMVTDKKPEPVVRPEDEPGPNGEIAEYVIWGDGVMMFVSPDEDDKVSLHPVNVEMGVGG